MIIIIIYSIIFIDVCNMYLHNVLYWCCWNYYIAPSNIESILLLFLDLNKNCLFFKYFNHFNKTIVNMNTLDSFLDFVLNWSPLAISSFVLNKHYRPRVESFEKKNGNSKKILFNISWNNLLLTNKRLHKRTRLY